MRYATIAIHKVANNTTQFNILLVIIEHWWSESEYPFPSKKLISERIGICTRQVQRQLTALESAGFIKRIQRYNSNGGKSTNEYDLSGLVKKVRFLAPEFIEAKNKIKKIKTKVETPTSLQLDAKQ